MIAVFLAIFSFAVITTILAFLTMDLDLKEDSSTFNKTRPIFLLAFAIALWFSSVGFLTAPAYTNTFYPNTNVIQTSGSTVTTTQYVAYNVTVQSDTPIATYVFYEYLALVGGIEILLWVLLIIYILRYGLTEFKETFEEMHQTFLRRKK